MFVPIFDSDARKCGSTCRAHQYQTWLKKFSAPLKKCCTHKEDKKYKLFNPNFCFFESARCCHQTFLLSYSICHNKLERFSSLFQHIQGGFHVCNFLQCYTRLRMLFSGNTTAYCHCSEKKV